jgi:hypothetical protein
MNRLHLLLSLLLSATSLSASEVTFQNGHEGYDGASDVTLSGELEKARLLNYGASETLDVAGVAAGGIRKLGLIRFADIVGAKRIPPGKAILSARLELYKIKDAGNADTFSQLQPNQRFLYAHAMQRPWKAGSGNGDQDPDGATFSHQSSPDGVPVYWGKANQIESGPVKGVDYQLTAPATSPLEQGAEAVWMQWDITEFFQDWVTNPEKNFGLLLTARSYYVGAQFSSCESPDQQLRPRIVVTY